MQARLTKMQISGIKNFVLPVKHEVALIIMKKLFLKSHHTATSWGCNRSPSSLHGKCEVLFGHSGLPWTLKRFEGSVKVPMSLVTNEISLCRH